VKFLATLSGRAAWMLVDNWLEDATQMRRYYAQWRSSRENLGGADSHDTGGCWMFLSTISCYCRRCYMSQPRPVGGSIPLTPSACSSASSSQPSVNQTERTTARRVHSTYITGAANGWRYGSQAQEGPLRGRSCERRGSGGYGSLLLTDWGGVGRRADGEEGRFREGRGDRQGRPGPLDFIKCADPWWAKKINGQS